MSIYGMSLIVFSALCSAAASILLKMGAAKSAFAGFSVLGVAHFYILAIVAYGLGFVAYAFALRSGSVSQIYPSMVGAAILFIFLWNAVSGLEVVGARGMVGSLLVVAGVYLLLSVSE